MYQILKVAENYSKVKSYSDLGERLFGSKGKLLVDICILVKQLGSCVTYLYFVSTQIDFILCHGSNRCFGNKVFMLILLIPVIIIS